MIKIEHIDLNNDLSEKAKEELDLIIDNFVNNKNVSDWTFFQEIHHAGIRYNKNTLLPVLKELNYLKTEIEKTFAEFEIKLFPYAGSLLGLVRDNGPILHDDDSDYAASFKLINDNFSEISSKLLKKGITIRKQLYEKSGFYIYHVYREIKAKFIIGNKYFEKNVIFDIFPTVSFDNERLFHKFFQNFLLAMISCNNDRWNEIYRHNIYNTNYLKFINKKKDYSDYIDEKPFRKFYLNFEKKLTKKNRTFFINQFKFKHLYKKINDGSQENVMIVSLSNYFQIPINNVEIKIVDSIIGKIKYLATPEDNVRNEIKYGENWMVPVKIPVIHSLSRTNYKGEWKEDE